MRDKSAKTNNSLRVNIFFGLIIILSSCFDNEKHQVFIDKTIDINIICDSINLSSEVSFFTMYFHLMNYSKDNIFISFNNEKDTLSKKSLIFITSKRGTIPIWYPKIDLGINLFQKRTVTFFMGMIEKNKFRRNYENFGKNIGSMEYFKKQLPNSEVIYIPDHSKFINNFYHTNDTILSIKGNLNVEIKDTKVLFLGDTYSKSDSFEFKTKKF